MYTKTIFAFSGALLALAAAVPMQEVRRDMDVVMVTETKEVVVTIPVTKTVWLEPGETAPSDPSPKPVHHHHLTAPAVVHSTVTVSPVAPAPETSQASPEAPPPSSAAPPPASSAPAAAPSSPAPSAAAPSPVASSAAAPSSPAPSSSALPVPSSGTTGDAEDDITDGPAASGTSYVGDVTWYSTGLGACGFSSSASDHIVAVSETIFDYYEGANPNDDPICNQWVEITGVDGTVYPAKVVDRCTGCDEESLDLSYDFFNLVTNNGNGRVHDISWRFA